MHQAQYLRVQNGMENYLLREPYIVGNLKLVLDQAKSCADMRALFSNANVNFLDSI
jgi:hypothetical protein